MEKNGERERVSEMTGEGGMSPEGINKLYEAIKIKRSCADETRDWETQKNYEYGYATGTIDTLDWIEEMIFDIGSD